MSRRLLAAAGVRTGGVITPPPDPGITPIPDAPIPYAFATSRPYNPPVPCPIATYDGSNETVHPSIHDFGPGQAWNGYRYWMFITPYPELGGEDVENPSLYVSNNGWDWHTPVGVTNPVFPSPSVGYNSDPDLTYDPVAQRLELIYRPMDQPERIVRSYSSANGLTWSPIQTIIQPFGGIISPAIIRLSSTSWRIYGRRENYGVAYWTATSPGGPWSGPNECVIDPGGIPQVAPQYIWHMDAIGPSAATGGRYLFLFADGSLTNIYTGWSTDGVNITCADDAVITARSGQWDANGIYRAAFTLHENGTHARVWYSGSNGKNKTGLAQIPLTEWS